MGLLVVGLQQIQLLDSLILIHILLKMANLLQESALMFMTIIVGISARWHSSAVRTMNSTASNPMRTSSTRKASSSASAAMTTSGYSSTANSRWTSAERTLRLRHTLTLIPLPER